MLDAVVFIVTVGSLIVMHDTWAECVNNFEGWDLSIICLIGFSLALGGAQAFGRMKMKKYIE